MLDLDTRWDEIRVGHMFPEEDKSVTRSLDVADGLLFLR